MYKACIYKALEKMPLEDMKCAIAVGLVCPREIDPNFRARAVFVTLNLDWSSCCGALRLFGVRIERISFYNCNIQCNDIFSDSEFMFLKPMINRKEI